MTRGEDAATFPESCLKRVIRLRSLVQKEWKPLTREDPHTHVHVRFGRVVTDDTGRGDLPTHMHPLPSHDACPGGRTPRPFPTDGTLGRVVHVSLPDHFSFLGTRSRLLETAEMVRE